jgi:hypothetical protein
MARRRRRRHDSSWANYDEVGIYGGEPLAAAARL